MVRKRLGELVLRTTDIEAMTTFYRDVIGLEEYASLGSARFFKVSEDLIGHPQILALFKAETPSNGPKEPHFSGHDTEQSPLHHFAFAFRKEDFASELARLMNLGHELRTATHLPMQWRSLYIYDPDGNTVEFVCYDETFGGDKTA